MNGNDPLGEARAALKEVEGFASSIGMYSTDVDGAPEMLALSKRRRRVRAGEPDPVTTVSLVRNDEGVLLWREGAPREDFGGRRRLRRGFGAVPIDGELVDLYHFEKLEPNAINKLLTDLDHTLNDRHGLFEYTAAELLAGRPPSKPAAPTGEKRRLLLIHGTFSKSEAFAHGIAQAKQGGAGASFVKRVFAHYDEVLAFEHPTLSLSPVLNAFDLSRLMGAATGPLDIVAHSRGGLVTRWFLEGFGAGGGKGPYQAVLVGSPLGGTSLASPPQLKSTLSLLSNFGTALKTGGAAAVVYMPLLAAPLALLKIATSVVSVAAKTPLIDAAVTLVPGLAGQSRVKLNHELDRVRAFALARPPTYFVVQSNFESAAVGFKFWRWFRPQRLLDAGADAIFPAENDLVVDTRSMSEFANPQPPIPLAHRHDFLTSETVHHTNYFEQPDTLGFILTSLKVP